MGFVGKIVGHLDNIQMYYILGLFIFIGLFILIIVRTIKMKKADIISVKTSILDEKEQNDFIHS